MVGLLSVWLRGEGLRGIGLGRRHLGLKTLVVGSAFGIAYQAVSLALFDPFAAYLTGVHQDLSTFAGIHGNIRLLALDLILAWTLAAFGEELAFRGYLLNRLAQLCGGSRGSLWIGVVFSSVLWTLPHFYQGITGVILVAVHGIVFGLLYVLAGRNLWMTIFAHGVYDTAAFLLIFFGVYPNLGS